MVPEIKKILYATDLSPNSGYVLRYALNAAKRHQAKLVVLHVMEELPPTAMQLAESFMGNEKITELSAESRASAREKFLKRLQAACKDGYCIDLESDERIESIEVQQGHTADLILSKAEEFDCDVIFMGTHGKGFLKHPYFGSTSKEYCVGYGYLFSLSRYPKGIRMSPIMMNKMDKARGLLLILNFPRISLLANAAISLKAG